RDLDNTASGRARRSRAVDGPGIFAGTVGHRSGPGSLQGEGLAMHRKTRLRAWAAAALAGGTLAAGCVVAAAGAGAGGGIYFTQRGAESVVPATVDRAAAATKQAFTELKIRETKSEVQHVDNGGEKREIEGSAADRDVAATIKSAGQTTAVHVVAKTGAATRAKDRRRA